MMYTLLTFEENWLGKIYQTGCQLCRYTVEPLSKDTHTHIHN